MKRNLLIIIACLGIAACNDTETNKIEREGEPTIYSLEEEDQGMNNAIKMAIQTLDTFNVALNSRNENYSFFAIKNRFTTPNGGEHIWLTDIEFNEGQYFGVVGNVPESTDEVDIGDTVKIDLANISDWMFFDNGKVKGGYTIRVLRDRMTKEEQQQFDIETGLTFE